MTLSRDQEVCRQKILAILARDGGRYAVAEDHNTDPVLMALATPKLTCEVQIPGGTGREQAIGRASGLGEKPGGRPGRAPGRPEGAELLCRRAGTPRRSDGAAGEAGAPAGEPEAADRTCPRCAGEGCAWCGGMGRVVDDQAEERRG
jgi:hypothetical protein